MPTVALDEVAAIIRRVAAAEVMPRWRNLAAGDVVEKDGPADLVTVADKACEAALAPLLLRFSSGSRVVGEEAVSVDATLVDQLRRPGETWVIDPIDGTAAFAAGEPEFAVMVARVVDGVSVAGWIYAPVADEMVYGGRGEGVWRQCRDEPASRLPPPVLPLDLQAMTGVVGRRAFSEARRRELMMREINFKRFAPVVCAGIDYPQLADGRSHFALYNKSEPWDHLPGLALLAEQGLYAAKHDGTPYLPGDNSGGLLIAPDPASWSRIAALLLA